MNQKSQTLLLSDTNRETMVGKFVTVHEMPGQSGPEKFLVG